MWAKNKIFSQWSSEAVQYVCVKTHTDTQRERALTAGGFSSLTLGGWLEYVDMFLYHFHEPPPRHPRVFSVFYISLLLVPPTPSLSDTHTDSNRHTNTPSGGCTYSPSDRQSWSPPTQKLTETLLILPPVVVDTGYVSLHINYLSQQGCRETCVCMHVCHVCLCACVVFFFWGNVFICLGLCMRVCLCLSPRMCQRFLLPCFIQWEVRGSSTNSSPNVLNELFWSDGCRAASPAVPSTTTATTTTIASPVAATTPQCHAATQPRTHPQVCLNSLPTPCRFTIRHTVTMATVSTHTSSWLERLDGDTPWRGG